MIYKKRRRKKRKDKKEKKRSSRNVAPTPLHTDTHARKGNLWIIMHVTVGMSGFWFQRV
jgi:hypothetical protein